VYCLNQISFCFKMFAWILVNISYYKFNVFWSTVLQVNPTRSLVYLFIYAGWSFIPTSRPDATHTHTHEWQIPVSHRYSNFSWWWAHSCPKNVEKKNILSRIVHLVGFICKTAAKILKSNLFYPEDRDCCFRKITDNYQIGYKLSLSTTLLSHQHYLKNMAM
jgi:hypothetical protein